MSDKRERGLIELYDADPERADREVFGRVADANRRGFLKGAGLAAMTAAVGAPLAYHANMPAGLIPAALADTGVDFQLEGKAPGLTVLNDRPVNIETPAHMLDDEITPNDRHFVRNNGNIPEPMDAAAWRLKIDGEVDNALELTLDQLKNDFETVSLALQLECGGNGRSAFNPSPRGNQWTVGAIGNAEWTGVRLRDVLNRAGVKQSAVYTGHYSYDPHLSGDPERDALSRGGPIAKMMEEHTLLAFQMNGEDIPLAHGYPVRIVAAGWPGSVSQKWLTRIWVRDQEHDGQGMTGQSYRVPRYPVEPGAEVPEEDMVVLEAMPVKSIITFPETRAQVSAGQAFEVRGNAWAGEQAVAEMYVSLDYGVTWVQADLQAPRNKYAWQRWSAELTPPQAGYYEVWARAVDDQGRTQPMVLPGWNPRGYANNSAHRIAVFAA